MTVDRRGDDSVALARSRRGRAALGVAVAAFLGTAWGSGCSGQAPTTESNAAPPSLTELAGGYIRLARGVHPAARPELDRGAVDPGRRIANLSMGFRLSPEQLADREALKAALVDPSSPSFRNFLTPGEYAARFGAPRATVEHAKAWLASQGLEVHEDSPLGARVTFSGTVEKIQAAFRTELRRYEVEGEMHYAARLAPAMPADLGGVVADITNLHDFHPRPMLQLPRTPDYSNGSKIGIAPPDWANVYDAAKLYTTGIGGKKIDGTGVSIAVVGVAQIAQSDIDAWRSQFNLGTSAVTMTLVPNTGSAAPGQSGTGFEAVLDVEWSGGIAPGATVNYVYTGVNDGNVDDATFYAIENDLAPVLSESWGGCEEYYVAAGLAGADQNLIDIYGSAANVLGITYVAASGDAGAGCAGGIKGIYTQVPAAFPGVTAVGGTQFPKGALSGSPYFTGYSAQETVWNESNSPTAGVASGGGGLSLLFSRPSYQSAIATCAVSPSGAALPVSGVDPSKQRQVPDVSFTSADGASGVGLWVECTISGGDCGGTGGAPRLALGGGTSFATPAFAGVVAMMNQQAGGRLGNINPLLYTLQAHTPTAFHDIATGDNEIICTSGTDPGCAGGLYGYAATSGYDCATGLGSMDVYDALAAIATQTATSTALALAPTSTSEGTPVSMTATISAKSGSTALGGLVTFAFLSYDAMGAPDLSWTLGTGTVSGNTSSGTATLSAAVPPGLVNPGTQSVDVVAMYGGDATHLPSTSPKVKLSFAPLAFAVLPASPSVAVGGTIHFTSTGGVAPVKWFTGKDTTCDSSMPPVCSKIVEATGVFTAGPVAGTTVVQVLDADGAELVVTVNVTNGTMDAGTDSGASDSGAPSDSGPADSGDSSAAGSMDSGASGDDAGGTNPNVNAATDGGGSAGSGDNKGGCGCHAAGAGATPSSAWFGIGGLAIAALRRRRRGKGASWASGG